MLPADRRRQVAEAGVQTAGGEASDTESLGDDNLLELNEKLETQSGDVGTMGGSMPCQREEEHPRKREGGTGRRRRERSCVAACHGQPCRTCEKEHGGGKVRERGWCSRACSGKPGTSSGYGRENQ